ncbi:MAG: 3-hydroxylacyl-ACP dehydratase, partial [Deltaproteobacteria bacterium]|nr:3-hydroxylacyl-ACP dehydratase [Deltaproteobacteria bacterium]
MSAFPPPAELLPHTPPMILIDEVLEYQFPHVRCRATIRPDSVFVEDGKVPGLVCIEYMAQTIGAIVGLGARSKGQPIRIGFLLGTREMSVEVDHFEVGDELILDADHVFGEEMLGSFKCSVSRRGQNVASALI